jgi:colanic acid biosynthesis glycosyl transferase WcaI
VLPSVPPVRFVLVNQFYAPDVAPTGQVLSDLAAILAARGHDVLVVCSRGSYDGGTRHAASEVRDGVHVRRLFTPRWGGRSLQHAAFLSGLSAALLRGPRPDAIVSLTTPPYVGLWVRAAANLRRVRHAHWVMDVYPDVLAAHGWLEGAGPAMRLLRSLARLQLQGAALVLGLGPVQSRRVGAYAPTVPWVPLWSPTDERPTDSAVGLERAGRGWAPRDVVFMYAGHLGQGHTVAEFLEAARRLGPGGPLWAFGGSGPRAGEVAAFMRGHPAARVQTFPYVARARLAQTLAAADVHLASIRGSWQGLIVPSKVQAAFGAGRPVLLVAGRENEAAQWVEESGAGWRVDEGDVDGLLRAVEQAGDAGERARRGQAALAHARAHFDRQRNGTRIAELLEEAASPSPTR